MSCDPHEFIAPPGRYSTASPLSDAKAVEPSSNVTSASNATLPRASSMTTRSVYGTNSPDSDWCTRTAEVTVFAATASVAGFPEMRTANS